MLGIVILDSLPAKRGSVSGGARDVVARWGRVGVPFSFWRRWAQFATCRLLPAYRFDRNDNILGFPDNDFSSGLWEVKVTPIEFGRI